MRRAAVILALSALGGCSLLTDLSDLSRDAGPDSGATDATMDAGPDAPQDGGPQDSGPCADGGAAVVETATPSNADTIILPTSPTLNWGDLTVANASEALPSAALLRFTVSAAAAAAFNGGRVVSVEFTLTRVLNDTACGGSCPSAAGTLTIQPLTTNWAEGDGKTGSGASWNTRNGSAAWTQPGALGVGTDIAAADASVAFDGNGLSVSLTLPGAAFSSFVASSQVAIRIAPSGGAIFVIATRENTTYTKPSMKVTYCP